MLNMAEWWILLNLPLDEIKQVTRFKNLTEEQKTMTSSATRTGNYTEGVIISKKMTSLFRVARELDKTRGFRRGRRTYDKTDHDHADSGSGQGANRLGDFHGAASGGTT